MQHWKERSRTEPTGRNPLRRRKFSLYCSALKKKKKKRKKKKKKKKKEEEEEEEEETKKKKKKRRRRRRRKEEEEEEEEEEISAAHLSCKLHVGGTLLNILSTWSTDFMNYSGFNVNYF
jgi:hypothetical protein